MSRPAKTNLIKNKIRQTARFELSLRRFPEVISIFDIWLGILSNLSLHKLPGMGVNDSTFINLTVVKMRQFTCHHNIYAN